MTKPRKNTAPDPLQQDQQVPPTTLRVPVRVDGTILLPGWRHDPAHNPTHTGCRLAGPKAHIAFSYEQVGCQMNPYCSRCVFAVSSPPPVDKVTKVTFMHNGAELATVSDADTARRVLARLLFVMKSAEFAVDSTTLNAYELAGQNKPKKPMRGKLKRAATRAWPYVDALLGGVLFVAIMALFLSLAAALDGWVPPWRG